MSKHALVIPTTQKREIVDLTDRVQQLIDNANLNHGTCHLFVQHTTAAITTGEMGENTPDDFLNFLAKLVPTMEFRHTHDPSHAPDHMLASLVGQSLTIPAEAGKLALGTWQRIYLVEFDGPRERSVIVTMTT